MPSPSVIQQDKLGSSLHSARVFLVTARRLGEGDQFSAENIVSMYYPHR